MWKQLLDIGKQLISLTRDVQQNKETLKDLQHYVGQSPEEGQSK
jgi:hypothetical protein